MTATATTTLEFRWTTSRGRDTYGYNVCTLYADGRKVARCNGGGYDMEGTCLGTFLETFYADRLNALTPDQMPAQSHWERAAKPRWFCNDCDGKIPHGRKAWDEPDYPACPKCGGHNVRPDQRDGKTIDDGRYFYGLRFVDPTYDARTAKLAKADGCFTSDDDVGKTLGELSAAGKLVDLDLIRAHYKQTSPVPTKTHTVPSIDGACGKSSVEAIAKAIGLELQYVPNRSKKVTIYQLHDKRA